MNFLYFLTRKVIMVYRLSKWITDCMQCNINKKLKFDKIKCHFNYTIYSPIAKSETITTIYCIAQSHKKECLI